MIDRPLRSSTSINLSYRLSELVRRTYEHDAMGHLLAAAFISRLFNRGVIGVHPGLELIGADDGQPRAEVDVLVLLAGDGGLVPIEVKDRATHDVGQVAAQLSRSADLLGSKWSAAAVCQYATDIDDRYKELKIRSAEGTYSRVLLTNEHLLNPHPAWPLAGDPFEAHEFSAEQIDDRESNYRASLEELGQDDGSDWLASRMLNE